MYIRRKYLNSLNYYLIKINYLLMGTKNFFLNTNLHVPLPNNKKLFLLCPLFMHIGYTFLTKIHYFTLSI